MFSQDCLCKLENIHKAMAVSISLREHVLYIAFLIFLNFFLFLAFGLLSMMQEKQNDTWSLSRLGGTSSKQLTVLEDLQLSPVYPGLPLGCSCSPCSSRHRDFRIQH